MEGSELKEGTPGEVEVGLLSLLTGSYTYRRHVMEFCFSVLMFHGAGVQEPLTAALRTLSVIDALLKISQHPVIEPEPGFWFTADNAIALTVTQVTKYPRAPPADLSQSQVRLAC